MVNVKWVGFLFRFCCDRWSYESLDLPGEQREMMLLFRSHYTTPYDKRSERVGFKVRVSAGKLHIIATKY